MDPYVHSLLIYVQLLYRCGVKRAQLFDIRA